MRFYTLKTRASTEPLPSAHPRAGAGFTLVELMVSLVILGLIMTVIFSLFSTTSDGLKEADSLVDTMDRARFAIERVSADMKSAAAFSSPDSKKDPWVIQNTTGQLCVQGVAGYQNWQNSVAILNTKKQTAHNGGATAEGVSYDGFIVMGAREFPQTFEVSNFVHTTPVTATIRGHSRGVVKLLANNPFYMETTPPAGISDPLKTHFVASLPGRLLRVADRDGNLQFTGIQTATLGAVSAGDSTESINLTLLPTLQVRQSAENGSAYQKGLDPATLGDDDIGYGAALIDAYWYHVERSPLDPQNFRLVRERLDAAAIATALCAPNNVDPASHLANPSEKVVITDRVADFQVWFDCADAQGNLSGATWLNEWGSPDGGGSCMDLSAPNFGAARMAHIRLSLHTRDERTDVPDEMEALFALDAAGDPNGALRYFNIYPDAPGAARVVTVQADIALNTFSMRNIR